MDEVTQARPEINKAVETMLKKGKWTVPGTVIALQKLHNDQLMDIVATGYSEKFGDLNMA